MRWRQLGAVARAPGAALAREWSVSASHAAAPCAAVDRAIRALLPPCHSGSLAVLLVENPWLDPQARSFVGAVGLMQVMPFHAGAWGCPGAVALLPSLVVAGLLADSGLWTQAGGAGVVLVSYVALAAPHLRHRAGVISAARNPTPGRSHVDQQKPDSPASFLFHGERPAEETPEGILIRPAMTVPIEVYGDERKAEFLLSSARTARWARKPSLGLAEVVLHHAHPSVQLRGGWSHRRRACRAEGAEARAEPWRAERRV